MLGKKKIPTLKPKLCVSSFLLCVQFKVRMQIIGYAMFLMNALVGL